MKAELIERREVYIRCPRCGDEKSHRVTNLQKGARFGISYCESCGLGLEGFNGDDGVEIRSADEGKEVAYVLLRIHPDETPLFLMVHRNDLPDYGMSPPIDIRQVVAVRYDDKSDIQRDIKYVVPPALSEPDDNEK